MQSGYPNSSSSSSSKAPSKRTDIMSRIISLIAAFCGLSFLIAIKITSKLSNFILHQFGGLHKLWDTPKATIPVVLLPKIVALSVQTLVHLPSLSSRLLLRNISNFSHYSGLSAMSLSSLNRSNSKVFRHILPCVAPFCEGMYYHKTGVPWQMKRTLVFIVNSLF